MIAIDDCVAGDPREPLLRLADIIKVEMKLTTPAQQVELIKRFSSSKCRMLAEKVETREEFACARNQGFHYFQGYFFRRPEMMTTRRHAGEPDELSADVAGGFASGTGCPRPGEADQGRSLSLLPAAALSEFRDVWLQERNSLRTACALDSGRAGCSAVGAAGRGCGGRTGENQRSGAVGAGARAVRRIAVAAKWRMANPTSSCWGCSR